jgi:hypothetical protein
LKEKYFKNGSAPSEGKKEKSTFYSCKELMDHIHLRIETKKNENLENLKKTSFKSVYVGFDNIVKKEEELFDRFVHFETKPPLKLKCGIVGDDSVGKSLLKKEMLKERGGLFKFI